MVGLSRYWTLSMMQIHGEETLSRRLPRRVMVVGMDDVEPSRVEKEEASMRWRTERR